MPYKSNSQRKLFHAKEARGEISKKTVDEFDKASKGKKLPEHVKKSKPSASPKPKSYDSSGMGSIAKMMSGRG